MKQLLKSFSVTCEGDKAGGDFHTPKAHIFSVGPDHRAKFKTDMAVK